MFGDKSIELLARDKFGVAQELSVLLQGVP